MFGVRMRAASPELTADLDVAWTDHVRKRGYARSDQRRVEVEQARTREAEAKRAERKAIGKTVECPGCCRRFVTEVDRDSHVRARHPEHLTDDVGSQ
jgi:hypothetical protein